MSILVVVFCCALSFLGGAVFLYGLAAWLTRPSALSEAQRRRASEQELQRLTYDAMTRLLAEARRPAPGGHR